MQRRHRVVCSGSPVAVRKIVKVPTVEGLALALNVSRDTVYAWAHDKDKPEFSDTLERLQVVQKQVSPRLAPHFGHVAVLSCFFALAPAGSILPTPDEFARRSETLNPDLLAATTSPFVCSRPTIKQRHAAPTCALEFVSL